MKRISTAFLLCLVSIVCFIGCQTKTEQPKEAEKYYLTQPKRVYQDWFKKFEKDFPDWLETESGFDTLKVKFQNEMISNQDFRRALMNAAESYELDIHFRKPQILLSESMGKYKDTVKNESGEMKIFLMYAKVDLKKPMFNGEKDFDLYYEILSSIPSTEKEHEKPYLEYSDTCILAKDIYYNNRKCSPKILGSFIIK